VVEARVLGGEIPGSTQEAQQLARTSVGRAWPGDELLEPSAGVALQALDPVL